MAAQYSNRQFFRKVPNKYLERYFRSKHIQTEVDIERLKENDVDALQGIANQLSNTQRTEIEADFQGVNALACEGGAIALADEAHFHDDEDFIRSIKAIDGFHAKAMWAFLEQPLYWQGAARFLHADNVSASYWRKRNDLPHVPPHVEDEDIDALAKAISHFFYNKEGRGENCIVEPYRRHEKEYFLPTPKILPNQPLNGWAVRSQIKHTIRPSKSFLSTVRKMAH